MIMMTVNHWGWGYVGNSQELPKPSWAAGFIHAFRINKESIRITDKPAAVHKGGISPAGGTLQMGDGYVVHPRFYRQNVLLQTNSVGQKSLFAWLSIAECRLIPVSLGLVHPEDEGYLNRVPLPTQMAAHFALYHGS